MFQNEFDLGLALNIITTLSVVTGIVFGLFQLRHAMKGRRDHAAVDIVRTVQTQVVRNAVSLILKLPNDVDPTIIREDPKLLEAAYQQIKTHVKHITTTTNLYESIQIHIIQTKSN